MKRLLLIAVLVLCQPLWAANVTNLVSAQWVWSGEQVTTFPSSGVVAFYPTNITGAAFYISYLDLPTNDAVEHNWTNEIGAKETYTNMNATSTLTNTVFGMFFDGVGGSSQSSGSFFKNGAHATLWNPTNMSLWVCLTPKRTNQPWDAVFANSSSSGGGLFLSSGHGGGCFTYSPNGTAFYLGWPVALNNQLDMAITDPGSPSLLFVCYTNGVVCATNNNVGTTAQTFTYGVGQDNDSDTDFNGYLKFILLCTNYTFTLNDITNLHNYATTH